MGERAVATMTASVMGPSLGGGRLPLAAYVSPPTRPRASRDHDPEAFPRMERKVFTIMEVVHPGARHGS